MSDSIITHETNLNEIILCAAQDKPLDGFGDLQDIHLHTILRELYRDHANGAITKENAVELKNQYISAWKADKETMAAYIKTLSECQDKIRTADKTGIQLHKAESLRDFAVGAAKIIELLTGDTGLVKMAEKLPEVGF